MDIFEFVSSYKNHPVLFVGTGLSLRYLNNSFNWEGLLKYVAIDLYGTDEKFYDMKNKVHKTHDGSYDLMQLAQLLVMCAEKTGGFNLVN
ncbi:hypothetical protein [Acinetobacter baumannii]|uniref:hypothetical protein n=1 Tax=Acinetobacter baumannii TaxID=470 RepID=UPI0038CDC11B